MEIEFRSRRALWISLALIVFTVWLYAFGGGGLLRAINAESGPVQSLSAIAYLVALILAIAGAARARGALRAHLVLWAVLCLLFFAEETSWLQHQIGYATPEPVMQQNAQREFNIHNLHFLQGGQLFSSQGDLNWRVFVKSQNLFRMGFFAYFLVLPLLSRIEAVRQLLIQFRVPSPGVRFAAVVWLPIAISILLTAFSAGTLKVAIAETRELMFALTIALFLWLVLRAVPAHDGTRRAG